MIDDFNCFFLFCLIAIKKKSCEYIEAEKRMVVTRRYVEADEVGRHRSKVTDFQYIGKAYRAKAFYQNHS